MCPTPDFLQTLRYLRPPESLLMQLNVYTEEKQEDEEDMRERMQNLMKREAGQRTLSEPESLLEDVISAVENDEQLQYLATDNLRQLKTLVLRDVDQ
jgi:diaphanous 1